MARSDPHHADGERRTGIVRGSIMGRAERRRPRLDWMALAIVAILAGVALVVVTGMLSGGGTTSTVSPGSTFVSGAVTDQSTEPTDSARASLLPPFSPEATPTARPTPSPAPTPSPTPTPPPSPSPTPSPTPSPSPALATTPASPVGSPQPTIPRDGLIIVEPADGRATAERFVVVRGLAQPGAVITRDIPLWFDEHVLTDSAGRWSFVLELNPGENVFTFRVGDDLSTERTLTVYYFAT